MNPDFRFGGANVRIKQRVGTVSKEGELEALFAGFDDSARTSYKYYRVARGRFCFSGCIAVGLQPDNQGWGATLRDFSTRTSRP